MTADSNGGEDHQVPGTPSVFLSDPDVTLWHGDVLAALRELPAESVDCRAAARTGEIRRGYGGSTPPRPSTICPECGSEPHGLGCPLGASPFAYKTFRYEKQEGGGANQ